MSPADKYLNKIAGLLNKAENTEFEEERNTFLAKAQELATMAEIDLEVARVHTKSKERQVPTQRHIVIGTKGDRGAGAYTDLFHSIAMVNDVECIMANDWVDAYGMEPDIDYTEALYAVVLNQMVTDCIGYIDEGSWRGETSIHDARKSFYEGYETRVTVRLRDAKWKAMSDAESKYRDQGISVALVVADKKKEVHNLYWTDAHRLGTRSPVRGLHRSSKEAGDHAGTRARISGDESISNKKALS